MAKETTNTAGGELDALRAENAALKAVQSQLSADEGLIRSKMAVGLSREQAIASIANQRAFDAKKSEVDAQKAKAKEAKK